MSPPDHGRRGGAWWIVAAAGVLGMSLAFSPVVRRLDWRLDDRFVSLATYEASPPANIVIVAIDQASVEQLGTPLPWPRRVHAALVGALASAGARTIVFDLVFDEPASTAEDDGILREAISRAGNVVLALRPIPSLASAAAGLGAANLPTEPDGIVRRYRMAAGDQPSLAAAASELTEGSDVSAGGLVPFKGRPGKGIQTVPYYQALRREQLPRGFFRGKTVFVGRSREVARSGGGAADVFQTAVGPMAGVEIHASALDAVMRGRFVGDPFDDAPAMALLLLATAALSGWLFLRAGSIFSSVVLALAATGWGVVGYALRAEDLARLPLAGPFVTAATVLVVMTLYRAAVAVRRGR